VRALTKRSSPRAIYLDARDFKSARNIQGAMKESGDVILSGAKIYLELGEAQLAGFHRAQMKRPFSSRSEWQRKILRQRRSCIERRDQ
jgi:hypothetical protein